MNKKLLFNITEDWFFLSHFLSRALYAKSKGYKIYVCSKNNQNKKNIESYGINFISLPFNRKNINPFYEIYILMRTILIYREIKPDIVHQIAAKPIIYGSIAAKICNIKSVINAPVGLGYVFTSNSIKAKLLKPLLKFLLKKLLNSHNKKNRKNKVIFENNDDLEYFINLGAVNRNDSVLIRGAGIKIRNINYKKESSKKITVTLVSRMLKDKGIYEFVSAVRKLKNQKIEGRFLLAGDIDLLNPSSLNRQTLINWNKEGVIEWLGWVDNIDKVLTETDIICLPSYREGLPKALLEGASFGLPIVTTDTVGCRDVVDEGINGFLVPIKNIDKLANKISLLMADKNLRCKMGKESLRIAKTKFSESIINDQTLSIYNELSN